jgi:hypothetical protein
MADVIELVVEPARVTAKVPACSVNGLDERVARAIVAVGGR